jgi:hypothetical protein
MQKLEKGPSLCRLRAKSNQKIKKLFLKKSHLTLAILRNSDILFFVMREMTEIEKKIQKLEAKIILDPKMYSLDPIRNHRIKVRLFNIARGELLEQDLKNQIKKISK